MHGFILNAQILLGLKVAVVVYSCEFRTGSYLEEYRQIFGLFDVVLKEIFLYDSLEEAQYLSLMQYINVG